MTATPTAPAGRRALPRFTDRIDLGTALGTGLSTGLGKGLPVSPFCLGSVGNWRSVPRAFEMGVNFFFVTTDMHWPLYEASRRGLADLLARPGVRDDIAIAGVCYPTQPEFCVAPFDELIDAVPGLERVDVRVAGGAYGPDLLARLEVLRRADDARAVAASFHDRRAALTAVNHRLVDLAYLRYNPLHAGARSEVFPELVPGSAPLFNFKSMVGYVPPPVLRQAGVDPRLWLPEAPDYYRYALSRDAIRGLLFAVHEPEELDGIAAGLERGGLLPSEENHLDELAALVHTPARLAAHVAKVSADSPSRSAHG